MQKLAKKWSLAGRVCLITGGTRGIGLACAKELGQLGAKVVISARNNSELEAVQKSLKADGINALSVRADATESDDRIMLAEFVEKEFGRLDVLVNNAGGGFRGKFVDGNIEVWADQLNLNVISTGEMSRLAFPLLKKSGGSIVNITSVASNVYIPHLAVYGSAKAAISFLTHALAAEWASDSVRVNAVAPWFTRTSASEKPLENPEMLNMVVQKTPMGRIAEANEIASVVAFLAMPAASYVTGQVIAVDGGMLSKGI